MTRKTKENLEGIAIFLMLAGLVAYMLGLPAKAEWYGVASVGKSHAQLAQGTAEGGIAWQQKGFPHHEGITDTVWSLGAGYKFTRAPWLAAELRFHDLGAVTAHGQWRYDDDGEPLRGGIHTGDGGAKVKGLSLAGVARYPLTQNISVGVEAGAFHWDAAWRQRITSRCESYVYEPVKTRGIGPLIGVILSWRNVDIRYERFHVEPRDGNFNAIDALSMAIRF